MKPKTKFWLVVIVAFAGICVAFYFLTMHSDQHNPGTIEGAYYMESGKGKVIVINDAATITVGGKGSVSDYRHSWLIQLDAVTGKEIKRTENTHLAYFGTGDGKFWMTSSDSSVKLHSRDPYSLEMAEDYKSILAKAENKNPVFKGKIASWETAKYSGNLIITAYDSKKYLVSLLTFEASDYKDQGSDSKRPKGLTSVGLMFQDAMFRFDYIDSCIYELEGADSKQLKQVDKWHPTSSDSRYPLSEPYDITKKHALNDQQYINGAFVYDAFTREPLHFKGDKGMFIYHADRLGAGGKNLLTHVDASGKTLTQYDITQTDPKSLLLEAFVADEKLYLVFSGSVQARDASGKLLWTFIEDTQTHD